MSQLYAVRFKLADGEHIGKITLTKRNDALANARLQTHFGKVEVVGMIPTTNDRYLEMVKENKTKYPGRPSLAELTGGFPIRVLGDPDIVKDEE